MEQQQYNLMLMEQIRKFARELKLSGNAHHDAFVFMYAKRTEKVPGVLDEIVTMGSTNGCPCTMEAILVERMETDADFQESVLRAVATYAKRHGESAPIPSEPYHGLN